MDTTETEQKYLDPKALEQLANALAADLDAAGGEIVRRHAEAFGLEPAGVAWLLAQACLWSAVKAHFSAGRPLEELVMQVRAGWQECERVTQMNAARSAT